jgi:hypothetical protein
MIKKRYRNQRSEYIRHVRNEYAYNFLISRNWDVKIKTFFKNMEDFDSTYIQDWFKVIKSDKISFILYKFSLDYEGYFNIKCYIELKKNSRISAMKKLLGFSNNLTAIGPSNSSSSSWKIKNFISESYKPEKEIFWFGKPRYENSVTNIANYEFVKEYKMTEKAMKNYFLPQRFLDVLNKNHDIGEKGKEERMDSEVLLVSSLNEFITKDHLDYFSILKNNKNFIEITCKFVDTYKNLIYNGLTEGSEVNLEVRLLVFNYLSNILKLEMESFKNNKSKTENF